LFWILINMPKRRKHKQPKRRGRRSIRRKATSLVSRFSGQFVPNHMRTSMRLTGHVENSASTTYSEAGFTMNDMFDPQGSSGAAQCPGFDQMALLYNRYRVHGSKIKVRASLNSSIAAPTATALEAQLVVYPSTVSLGATTIDDGMSQPFAKMLFLSGEKPVQIQSTVPSLAKFIGNTISPDRMQALVSASPAERLYWHVGVISRAYTSISTSLAIEVTYDVEFFERNLLDRSTLDLLHTARLDAMKNEEKVRVQHPFVNNRQEPTHGSTIDQPGSEDIYETVLVRKPNTPLFSQKPLPSLIGERKESKKT
jgi:hypothetical protein